MRPAIFILLFSLLQPVLGETQRAEQLYTSQGCAACHQINQPVDPNKVMVGPPLAAVGSRYADDPKGLETILTSLRQGGGGKWGQNEMPPQSHLTKEHSGQLARWILTLRQEDGAGDNNKATQDPPKTVTHSPLIGKKRLGTVVQVTDTPLVYRTYLPGVSARAIAVGLPAKMGGISYAFSAAGCRLLYVWSGGFIDMEKAWTGHGGWYAGIIGERFYHAPAGFPLRIGNAFDLEENPSLSSRVSAWWRVSRVSSMRWMAVQFPKRCAMMPAAKHSPCISPPAISPNPSVFWFQAIGRLATRPRMLSGTPATCWSTRTRTAVLPSRSPSRSVCSHEPYVSITDSGLLVRPLVLTPHSGQPFLPG